MARPALALFYPELAGVRQPLAGEVARGASCSKRLPFATGYGVEIAMLIDAWREVGLDGIAQVDLDEHHNRHQPLSALAPMAATVLATIARRLQSEGRLRGRRGARRRWLRARRRRAPAAGGRERRRERMRCLYLDLDGTLLGRGASLLHDGEGASRSTACARCRRACAPTWRWC